MCACVYLRACAQIHVYVSTCGSQGTAWDIHFSGAVRLCVRPGLSRTFAKSAGWPAGPRDPSGSASPALGLQLCVSLNMGTEGQTQALTLTSKTRN